MVGMRWVGGMERAPGGGRHLHDGRSAPISTESICFAPNRVPSMPKVEIYTWRFCPFCIRAKQLLDRKGVTYTEYVIDGDEDARDAMVARGSDGKRSVPQIFIDGAHVGGCDDLYALERQGRLDPLLAVAS